MTPSVYLGKWKMFDLIIIVIPHWLSRESREKKAKCDRIAPLHPLSWPCVSDLHFLKARAATRRNPRWLANPNSSLTQYECGHMKPLLCPRHHRQVILAVNT